MSHVVFRDLEKFRILTEITILPFFRNSNCPGLHTKTEVTSHSEVYLVETITPVCRRSPEKLSRVVTRRQKFAHCPTSHHAPPAPERVRSTHTLALHAPSTCRAYVSAMSALSPTHCPSPTPCCPALLTAPR